MFVNYLGYKIEIHPTVFEHVQYIATNHDGAVFAYLHSPITKSGKWVSPRGLLFCTKIAQLPVADNWQDTLRKITDLQILGE